MVDLVDIWRVQTQDGVGPYRYGSDALRAAFTAAGLNDDTPARPSPLQDTLLMTKMDWMRSVPARLRRCGFVDLPQYFEWFEDENVRALLDADGFSLLRYQVPREHVVIGARQVLFDKSQAKMIGAHRCADAAPVLPQ